MAEETVQETSSEEIVESQPVETATSTETEAPQPVEGEANAAVQVEEPTDAQKQEAEEEVDTELEEKLPFPTACIVRLMKAHMDKEKMIKKDVKIAMNKWLGSLVEKVSKEMNKLPYVMMHIHEFQQAIREYEDIEEFRREKERILAHMEAMKQDIEKLERDLGKKFQSQLIS